jgi:hypothetical protein
MSVSNAKAMSGSNSLKADLMAWGGLQLGASTQGVAWQGKYTTLQFSITSSADATLPLWLSNSGQRVNIQTYANRWVTVNLNLATDLAAQVTIGNPGGLILQNAAANPITIYLDGVKLV